MSFAHAQYYLLDKGKFHGSFAEQIRNMRIKKRQGVITIIESRAAKTLVSVPEEPIVDCLLSVDGPLQTMKITGTPE